MTDTAGSTRTAGDLRVERTRTHVLNQARRLLAAKGPNGFTYCELAAQARVTRQTLYRHWPTRQALLVDLLLERSITGPPEDLSGSPQDIVSKLMRCLRDYLNDPAHAGPLVALLAQADHEPMIDSVLNGAVVKIREALNDLLEPAQHRMTPEQFARLCGPVIFQRFIARQPLSDELLDDLTADWLAGSSA